MATILPTDSMIESTRPEVQSWLRLGRAEFDRLDVTVPEERYVRAETGAPSRAPDIKRALAGQPLRLESRLAAGFGSETWLVRTTGTFGNCEPGEMLVAKVTTDATADSAEFFARASLTDADEILAPLQQRALHGGRTLSISPYLPLGSLRDYLRRYRLDQAQIRDVVRQLATVLHKLAAVDDRRVLVHGDVKPGNVLLRSINPISVVLTDFDHSRWVPKEGSLRHGGVLTRRYAAPEAVGGLWSSSSDFWSFGMVILELITGRLPFEGKSDEQIRLLLSVNWRFPDDLPSLSDEWRALFFGLLERFYAKRWRPEDVAGWLEGDRRIIAKGLAEGERSTEAPREIEGEWIYTARALARVLVMNWDHGVTLLKSPELLDWLRASLRAGDLASRLERLLADPALDDDARLIRFAYFANGVLKPYWREVRLSGPALEALAARALDGSAEAYQRLVALRDGTIAQSYASLGIDEPRQWIGEWRARWQRYESGWQRLIEAGAPAVRPPDEAALPALVRLWLSASEQRALLERVEERCGAVRYLLRRSWYYALGHDLPALPIEHQWILDSLEHSSLVETLVYPQRNGDFAGGPMRTPPTITDERLMDAVLFSGVTERLTRNVALDFRSRQEITLVGMQQPGQAISPHASDGLWTRMTTLVGLRFRELALRYSQWRQRRRRRAEPGVHPRGAAPEMAAEDDTVSISAVRVNLTAIGADNTPIGQIALLRWRVPRESRLAIRIGRLGFFGRRVTRQRIVRLPFRLEGAPEPNALQWLVGRRSGTMLPHRGQVVLASFDPSIVWLEMRVPRRRGKLRGQVLRLGASSVHLRPVAAQLMPVPTALQEPAAVELRPLDLRQFPLAPQVATVKLTRPVPITSMDGTKLAPLTVTPLQVPKGLELSRQALLAVRRRMEISLVGRAAHRRRISR